MGLHGIAGAVLIALIAVNSGLSETYESCCSVKRSSGCRNRRTQRLEIANLIGEQQNQPRIQRCALRIGQARVRFDQHLVEIIRAIDVRLSMQ